MPRYRWVIFDADGTLYDYDRAELTALSNTFDEYELNFSPDAHRLYARINSGLWKKFELGEVSSERLRVLRFEELMATLDVRLPAPDISRAYLKHLSSQRDLIDGAKDVVAELSRAARLVLATNGIADVQRSRFEVSPLRPYFDAFAISDEIGHAKPAPEFFQHVFDEIGNPDKSQVLMVGDGLSSDIAGGEGFGIDTCWFNPKGHGNETAIRPTYQVVSLAEVLEIAGVA